MRPRAHPGGPRGAPRLWVPLLGGGFSVSPFPCCSYRVKEMSPSPRTPCSPWGGLGHRPGGPVAPCHGTAGTGTSGTGPERRRDIGAGMQDPKTLGHGCRDMGTLGQSPQGTIMGTQGHGAPGDRGWWRTRPPGRSWSPVSPPRAVAGLYGVPPHPKKSPVAQGDLSGEVLGAETHFWCFPLLEPNE